MPRTRSEPLFFKHTDPADLYPLSLHDALPIWLHCVRRRPGDHGGNRAGLAANQPAQRHREARSEEHTPELQSQSNIVCRLLLEKKNPAIASYPNSTTGMSPTYERIIP